MTKRKQTRYRFNHWADPTIKKIDTVIESYQQTKIIGTGFENRSKQTDRKTELNRSREANKNNYIDR